MKAETADRLRSAIRQMAGRRVAVLGDLLADEFIYGTTERISREAPVLILRWQDRIVLPGGAGNAARNVRTLGGIPIAFGVTGTDTIGEELRQALSAAGVDMAGVSTDPDLDTVCKTRILSGGSSTTKQQVIRIDRGGDREVAPHIRENIFSALADELPRLDAILVSDYDCGLLGGRAGAERLNTMLADFPGVKVVDSRFHLDCYHQFTLCAPNEEEAFSLTGCTLENEDELERVGESLLEVTGNEHVLLTRGSRGMVLFSRDTPPVVVPVTRRDEIADVTGAGDTVAATVTVALASGVPPADAALLANVAGGIKVRKRGTATVSLDEIAAELTLLTERESA